MKRVPLGDMVNIGGPEFSANAGRVEFDNSPNSGVGETSHRNPASDPIAFPPSPGVDSLQVNPIIYDVQYGTDFPNNTPNRWKGIQEGEA